MRAIYYLIPMTIVLLAGNCPPQRSPSTSTSSLTSDCGEVIHIFNGSPTYTIAKDIQEIHSRRNVLAAELAVLYPDAREAWNFALTKIENNYTVSWSGVSVSSYDGPLDGWRQSQLDNVQKFFLLLTEMRWGPYERTNRDLIGKAAWAESATLDTRLNARIKLLQQACGRSDGTDVRHALKMKRLPETLNECLSVTLN